MEYEKELKCGCVIDTVNNGVIKFCKQHQIEHDDWVYRGLMSGVSDF